MTQVTQRFRTVEVAGAIVAVLLQVALAPILAAFSAQPNFLLVYALVLAILRPHEAGSVLPFVLGLTYDLLGTGPVGAMALCLIVGTIVASKATLWLSNGTPHVALLILAVSMCAIEMLYGGLMLMTAVSGSPVDAFLYRSLPCMLADCIVGLFVYFAVARLLAGGHRGSSKRASRMR